MQDNVRIIHGVYALMCIEQYNSQVMHRVIHTVMHYGLMTR